MTDIIKERLAALKNASTVLDWTIAVSMASWGQLHQPDFSQIKRQEEKGGKKK